MYGEDDKDDEKEDDKADAVEHDQQQSGDQQRSPSASTYPAPVPLSEADVADVSWKERYIRAEVDLCRQYITMEEVCSARFSFKFLPSLAFQDHQRTTFPRFTRTRLITGLDMTYDWRFVDVERDMPAQARERGEMTVYERRRLLTGEQIASIRTAKRPYWLRSSGTATPPLQPPSSHKSTARLASANTRQSATTSSSSSVGRLLLTASSALLSPSLPPYRFPPSHPFFRLSEVQLLDCSTDRRLQVSHFPALSIARLPDGGWQLLNQYVVFKSVHPDSRFSQQQQEEEDDGDDDENGSEDDSDDEHALGEGEGEGEGEESDVDSDAADDEYGLVEGSDSEADNEQQQCVAAGSHRIRHASEDDDEQMQSNSQHDRS